MGLRADQLASDGSIQPIQRPTQSSGPRRPISQDPGSLQGPTRPRSSVTRTRQKRRSRDASGGPSYGMVVAGPTSSGGDHTVVAANEGSGATSTLAAACRGAGSP